MSAKPEFDLVIRGGSVATATETFRADIGTRGGRIVALADAFARGITSFKVFMTYDLTRVDDGQFLDILAVAKAHGALTMVHAENNAMIEWMSKRLAEAGHVAPRYHGPGHLAVELDPATNFGARIAP